MVSARQSTHTNQLYTLNTSHLRDFFQGLRTVTPQAGVSGLMKLYPDVFSLRRLSPAEPEC